MKSLAVDSLMPEIVEWRRHLHRHPELSFHEKETSAFIADKLAKFGIEVRKSGTGYGVLGILRGSGRGKPLFFARIWTPYLLKRRTRRITFRKMKG